jgi:hypothetical protein
VSVIVRFTVQLFFSVNLVELDVWGDTVTATGLAVMVGRGGEQANANSGRVSVGDGSGPLQAMATAGNSRERSVGVRIVASFVVRGGLRCRKT